ncbi:glycosyl transferase [Tumebacillus sp. ITR2]|uniref:Glycosyl transferase n=1 Tax=Tumebacillus amylolyticus TaxID=2801339 RepID=A0ABS1J4C6_9BACL|nr:macrolide family glycosyltransferase [Tumebacillus amylolyticus]MBL0385124.1 glycosyl transferase [Tumebacillus amylolyticus]
MSKVLFIGGPGEGHVNPTLPLVKELIRRGEEVVYFCSEEYREKITETGAEFRAYADFLHGKRPEDIQHFLEFILLLLDSSQQVIPDILQQVQGEQYDYVIHDSLFGWGRLISQVLKVPSVTSSTSFASTGKPPKMFGQTKMQKVKDLLSGGKYIPSINRKSKQLASCYGIPVPSIDHIFYQKGDLNLVYMSEEFQPDRHRLKGEYVFVGPSIGEKRGDVEFPFEKLDGRPLVYVSIGTVLKSNSLFQQCIEAFSDLECQVIMSVGRNTDLRQFEHAPHNFLIRPYVPQLEILKRTDVFITHGGMNSTMEALAFHVPLIVVPQTSDQPMVAARIIDLGCGVGIAKNAITPSRLRSAVERLLQDSTYKKSAERIGDSLRSSGGYRRAADEIEKWKVRLSIG